MRIRIGFSRHERVKYLGHLDIMRTFQRAFIRSGVTMVYSDGFNPHQKMNFAQPLGVGITSSGEYLDAEIADEQERFPDLSSLALELSRQMGPGFSINSTCRLAEGAEKGMAAVRYAAYTVTVQGEAPDTQPFLDAGAVVTVKKTKSGSSEIDIKPLVYRLTRDGNAYKMVLQAGSENNLKPELLMQELYRLSGIPYERSLISIHRDELMAEGFMPLSAYQVV